MRFARKIITAGIAVALSLLAQSPAPFLAPNLKGDPPKNGPNAAALWKSLYANPHEASIGAMKVAKSEVRPNSENERAFNLFLMATQRDPTFSKPVFDLGVLCEMGERWDDALSFYRTVLLTEQGPAVVQSAGSEIERVKLLISLTATPEGRRTRDFDVELAQLLAHREDPAVAIERVNALSKIDKARWEAPAFAAELYAALDKYSEAAKSLEAAARLAPPERRSQLDAAAEAARAQAQYQELVDNGEKSWEDKKYQDAAKLYEKAWNVDQAHLDTGIQAAVAYLMADDIKQAVGMLSRLRESGAGNSSQKIAAMLKQLVPVSEDAKQALNKAAGDSTVPTRNALDRITGAIGDLASAEVKLVARPAPALLEDKTDLPSLPDPELSSGELAKLSPESIFEQYKRGVPALPENPDAAAGVPSQAAPADSLPSHTGNANPAPAGPPDRPTPSFPTFPHSTPPPDPAKQTPPK